MNKVGFCGNVEPHEQHEILDNFSTYEGDDWSYLYTCRGVDEEGRVNTEERTAIYDCVE